MRQVVGDRPWEQTLGAPIANETITEQVHDGLESMLSHTTLSKVLFELVVVCYEREEALMNGPVYGAPEQREAKRWVGAADALDKVWMREDVKVLEPRSVRTLVASRKGFGYHARSPR